MKDIVLFYGKDGKFSKSMVDSCIKKFGKDALFLRFQDIEKLAEYVNDNSNCKFRGIIDCEGTDESSKSIMSLSLPIQNKIKNRVYIISDFNNDFNYAPYKNENSIKNKLEAKGDVLIIYKDRNNFDEILGSISNFFKFNVNENLLTSSKIKEKYNNSNKEFEFTQNEIKLLKKNGEKDSDIKQMINCLKETKFSIIIDYDNEKKISLNKALELLGREQFISGLERSAFHWTAVRNGKDKDGKEVSILFDSHDFFKEKKEKVR